MYPRFSFLARARILVVTSDVVWVTRIALSAEVPKLEFTSQKVYSRFRTSLEVASTIFFTTCVDIKQILTLSTELTALDMTDAVTGTCASDLPNRNDVMEFHLYYRRHQLQF